MVRRVEVRLIDDLDGSRADQTIVFALDGQNYAVDLSPTNAQRLRELLAPFVAGARKAGRSTVRPRRARRLSDAPAGVHNELAKSPRTAPAAEASNLIELQLPAADGPVSESATTTIPVMHFSNPDQPMDEPGDTVAPATAAIFSHHESVVAN